MKGHEMKISNLIVVSVLLIQSCSAAEKISPEIKLNTAFQPGAVWKDTNGEPINAHGGGIYFEKGVYYWFGESRVERPPRVPGQTRPPRTPGETQSRRRSRPQTNGVSGYSSTDLLNWKNEGLVLPAVKDDINHDLHESKVIERPKVIHNEKTGKYVMWIHIDSRDYKYARSGVAVSDKVTGPYEYVESFRPNDSMARDMTVFVDDDGKAYHFYSSEENATMQVSLLSDDYLKPAGEFKRIFEGRYMEAPAILKHQGKYYFIASGCTGWAPNTARSAVADSIWGPWKEMGNPCIGKNAEKTFNSQSTYLLKVEGKNDVFIFMADRWNPRELIDSRNIWLPVTFEEDTIKLRWHSKWNMGVFDKN